MSSQRKDTDFKTKEQATRQTESHIQKLLRAVKEERDRYNLVLNSIPDEVWFADKNKNVTLANPQAVKEFGLNILETTKVEKIASSSEIYRSNMTPRPVEEAPLLRALKGEVIKDEEEIIMTPATGQLRYRQVNAVPVKGSKGEIVGSISIVRDITERKKAEEALRQSEKRYHRLFDSLPEGLVTIEIIYENNKPVDLRFLEVNPSYARLIGKKSVNEVIGKTTRETIGVLEDYWYQLYDGVVRTGKSVHYENYVKALDEHYEVVAWRTEDNKVAILCYNVTERKKAEEASTRQRLIQDGINTILEAALKSTREQLGEVCLKVAEEITKSAFGFIGEINPNGLEDIAISNPGWDACKIITEQGHRRPPGNFKIHGIYGRVLSDGRGFYTNDPPHHPDRIGLPKGHPPLQNFLGVPLKDEGKTIGMIAVANHAGGFTDADLAALEALAPTIVEAFARKKTEQALKLSEERARESAEELQKLMDIIPAAIWVSNDPECKMIVGNKAANQFYEAVEGENVSAGPASGGEKDTTRRFFRDGKELPPEELPMQEAAFKNKEIKNSELEVLAPSGRKMTILGSAKPLLTNEGKVRGCLAAFMDITERKKAEEAIRKQASLIDLSPDAIIVKKLDDTITFWSQGAQNLYGWTKEEALGKKSRSLLRTKFPEPYEVIVEALISEGQWSGEKTHQNKHGDELIVDSRWLASRNSQNEIEEILETNVNITERKKAEEALKQRTEQLEQTQIKLEENAVQLEEYANQMEELASQRLEQLKVSERMAAIGATAGMVGHDIRNPLQAITSDLYLAKEGLAFCSDNEGKKEALQSIIEIEKNVDYINKIVQDLQDYARPLNPNPGEADLKQIIEKLLSKNGIPENVKVTVKVEDEARKIVADADYLNRVLYNLVTNAVQAMPKGGNLTIRVYKEKSDVIITVKDTGVGIPKVIQSKMFTPMFTTKSKGQGFGLPVVKRMTESLGGAVSFESQEGKGTTFTIRLPNKSK
jgi:PAS domain S-box-containing protein